MRRLRAALRPGVLLLALGFAAALPEPVRLPAPARWLVADGPRAAGVTETGDLFTLEAGRVRLRARAFAAGPLAACEGRVAGVDARGELQLWTEGRGVVGAGSGLSPSARPVCLPGGVVAVAANGDLVRFEQAEERWAAVRRVAAAALPDAQPTLADPEGSGQAVLAVLTQPTTSRYVHGVLGDRVEAAGLGTFDPVTLRPRASLRLPAPLVFEDLQARPLRLPGAPADALVLVRSGPESGAALTLVRQVGRELRVAAAGPGFGQPSRWLLPVVGPGEVWAVHTPHLGGALYRYRPQGPALVPRRLFGGVSGHSLGSRNLNGAALVAPGTLVLPVQDGRRLLVLACGATCTVRQTWPLGAALSSNILAVGGQVVAGDAAGGLWTWPVPPAP